MDPKLQATYDKVMNTPTTPQSSVTPPAGQQSTVPEANNTQSPTLNNPTASTTGPVISTDMPQEVPQTPAYAQDNLNFQAAIQTPVVGGIGTMTPAPAAIVPPQHHTSPLLKTLYIIGAIVFFISYTFLWVKIFNLPVPFLQSP